MRSTTPLKSCFSPIGKLDFDPGLPCAANECFDCRKGLIEIGILPVELVDDQEARQLELVRVAPGQLRAHLHARDRVHQNQGAVGHAQGGDHSPTKSVKPGVSSTLIFDHGVRAG